MALSLVSVNVEHYRHLDRVIPFLKAEAPDVTCVHELDERDVPAFEEACGPCVLYMREGTRDLGRGLSTFGAGMFARVPTKDARALYYYGSAETIREDDGHSDWGTHVLGVLDAAKDGETYRIATTHFTWSERGAFDANQQRDLGALLPLLDSLGDVVFTGDLNAPRGREVFGTLAERYQDNIPQEHATSIDIDLHRAGKTHREQLSDKMVDGLFTTPRYLAKDVRLQFGVSDHAAVVATIEKAP